jgi:hypothetical protein
MSSSIGQLVGEVPKFLISPPAAGHAMISITRDADLYHVNVYVSRVQ